MGIVVLVGCLTAWRANLVIRKPASHYCCWPYIGGLLYVVYPPFIHHVRNDPALRLGKRTSTKLSVYVEKSMYLHCRSGRVVPARKTGPPCGCKRRCFDRYSVENRQGILASYNAMESKIHQDAYLFGVVCKDAVRR